MEKIKAALEKARQAQQGVHQEPTIQGNPESRTIDAEPITYSQSQVTPVNEYIAIRNRVIINDNNEQLSSAYKMLRTQVMQKLDENDWNSLAVTSPGPEQGKTLTAINLAISLAKEVNHTVLLVDFDMRRPSVHKTLGLNLTTGISDFLLRDVPLNKILINPGIERLVILPGQESLNNSSEMLKSNKMIELVEEVKSRYPSRIIIFDLPPLLSTDDALAFSPYVDSVLLVIEEGKTKHQDIEYSMDLLKGIKLLGTVLNKSSESPAAPY
jgi:protein-tyrosine kinase